MELQIYNTLSRKKEFFKPINPEEVRFYGCGPTVYWFQHIGGMRRYIFEDILYRTLKFNNYKIKHVINVTDVGHLKSDSDTGEDKVEVAAKKEGKTAQEITHFYFDNFLKDLKKVNFTMPDKWTWASEYIKEQIELVKTLEEKGFTYKTSDGIYFDTSKLDNYGFLARLNKEGLQAGKRIDFAEKKNKTDFALWKFSENPGERQQEWNSPWGLGFPGWHAECSAMSMKELGEQFDIHTGGIDNMNPHHINEIAQSECANNVKPWVKYWLHNEHLNLKSGKMSKSDGKIITLSDLEEKGYSPLVFRYAVLLVNYRKKIPFDFELLDSAKTAYNRLKNIIAETPEDNEINEEALKKFHEAVNNDLNTPEAIQVLWTLVRDPKAKGKINTIKKFDEVLALDLLKKVEINISKEVQELLNKRQKAREEKDWTTSDTLRDEIDSKGYEVKDTKEGQTITKK